MFKYFIFTKYEPRISIRDVYIMSFVLCFSYCIMELMFYFSLFQNGDYYGIGKYSPFHAIFVYTWNMVCIVKSGLSYKVCYICCFIKENRIGNMKQFFPTFFVIVAFSSVQLWKPKEGVESMNLIIV